ncbi:MAG TPA: hypothetical protein PKA32_01590, partial [Candidatus Gracilibacteria bacterium]|nr:hypothetical protein [Candidatus Gracilibacteria bacterium]
MNEKLQKNLKLLLALFGLVAVVLVAIIIPSNPQNFQGQLNSQLEQNGENGCQSLNLKTIPQNLTAHQSGTIIIETEPMEWAGPFSVSASSGTLTDASGNADSLFETNEKVINFSGGDEGSSITVQAIGSDTCIDSIEVQPPAVQNCVALTISTYPEPPAENESLEISIQPSPNEWQGFFLIQAESGKLTLSDADSMAQGTNTSTLITDLKKVLYNGGKNGKNLNKKSVGEGDRYSSTGINHGTEKSSSFKK